MELRTRQRLSQALLLLIGVVVAGLFLEVLLVGPILLAGMFPERPILGSAIVLLVGFVCFLCVRGSRMESRPVVSFVSRLVLLLFTITLGVVALEMLMVGVVSAGVALGHQAAAFADFLPLIAALALVALGAAGFKYAFGLRTRYWIVLVGAFVAVLLFLLISSADILFA